MKKTSAILRIIASSLIICVGAVLILNGLTGDGFYYSGAYTKYEAYGGDAYTGIQNAAADTAVNVARFANAFGALVDDIFLWSGVFVALFGLYLLAAALPDLKKEPVKESPKALPVESEHTES